MILTPTTLHFILLNHFKEQHWWPIDREYHKKNHTDSRFEIMIGAILTQNTAWANVEKALGNLKINKKLALTSIYNINISTLKNLIQPSGFFNQKAERLKTLAERIYTNYDKNLSTFFNRNQTEIRNELLSLNGIGPETADSILLYAGEHPIFVVDAYTRRICHRIPFKTEDDYDSLQRFFENDLKQKISKNNYVSVYRELHALIVELAKNYCRKKPICDECPINQYCNHLF